MGRRVPIILLILACFLAQQNVRAATNEKGFCNLGGLLKKILSSPEKNELTAGEYYFIHQTGTNEVRHVYLVEIRKSENNKKIFIFEEMGAEPPTFEVTEESLSSWKHIQPLKEIKSTLSATLIQNVDPATRRLQQVTKTKFKTLAATNEVEFVATSMKMQKQVEGPLRSITEFDSALRESGFTIPKKTRVIMQENSVIPDLMGPISFNREIQNVFDTEKKAVIAMNRVHWSSGPLFSTQVLRHERAHTVLNTMYYPGTVVNSNTTIQEALADFMTAHFSDNPVISFEQKFGTVVLRDISQPTRADAMERISSAIDFTRGTHGQSAVFGQTLWNVRQQIGKQEVNGFIKEFIDNLNAYISDDLFARIYNRAYRGSSTANGANLDLELLNYFFAVLIRSSEKKAWAPVVKTEIESIIAKYRLNPDYYKSVEAGLPKTPGETGLRDPKNIMGIILVGSTASGTSVIQSGTLLDAAH